MTFKQTVTIGMPTLIAVILGSLPVLSQTPGVAQTAFEVVSIKPYVDPGPGPGRFVGFRSAPGSPRLEMRGVTVRMLMTYSYSVRDFQVIGGPEWINSDQYDIEAKAEDGRDPVPSARPNPNAADPMAVRVQSLLADRFQLKMHRETRELPVYELTVAKGGAKLELYADRPPAPGAKQRGSLDVMGSPSGLTLTGEGVPLSDLISLLAEEVGRPIVDRSGLSGLYKIKLQWTPDPLAGGPPGPTGDGRPVETDNPSIFTAIQEQLGLRLVAGKGPVEVLIIDSAEKPSVN